MTGDSTCPVCAADGTPFDSHVRGDRSWRGFACPSCKLAFWSPREIDPAFYAQGHHDTYERRRRGESFLRERHHMFLRLTTPGRLFDIGCGEGAFLGEARARGYDATGIDLDNGNIAVARGRGLDVEPGLLLDRGGNVAEVAVRKAPYDWVTAFEVLEHQADPIEFLTAARNLLASGGRVCGSVPNRDRVLASRERRRNDGDFPPHHFLWFSAEALDHALRRAGFTTIEVTPIPERDVLAFASFLENALVGSWTGAVKRAGRAVTTGKRRGVRSLARAVKNIPFIPLAVGLRVLAPNKSRALYFEAS